MRRQDFLKTLHDIGYPITESKLRRYTEYGLLRPHKTSGGKCGGVRAEYSNEMIEAVVTVERLQCNPNIEDDREFIFVLFAQGYPVNYEVLKEYFTKHFFELVAGVQEMAGSYQDDPAAFIDWFIVPSIQEQLPKLKPGRPSSETLLQRETLIQREISRAEMGQFLWSVFAKGEVVTVEDARRAAEEIGFNDAEPDTIARFGEMFRRDLWAEVFRSATEEDFREIQRIFTLGERFVEAFMETDPESIPILGWRIAKSREYLKELRFIETPRLVKMAILLLLMPDWRRKAADVLSSEENLRLWGNMIRDFKQALMDVKGGEEK